MKILVTGANGFVGRVLVARLLAQGLGGRRVEQLVACDVSVPGLPDDARLRAVVGSITEPAVLAQALSGRPDVVFHLASLPGGAAERDPVLGRRINLDATVQLVEQLGRQGSAPRLVFASTVAVYGEPLPARVDEHTPAQPALSYGAHKLAAEILIADAARRGEVHACSLRLPGIVARPGDGAGLVSAFMSQLFWKLRDGQPLVLPVSAEGTAWWMSVATCVDNLLHAATLDTARTGPHRVVQLPALHLSMQAVIDALARRFGEACRAGLRFAPEDLVQRLFASYPPLDTPAALALGFAHDGDADALVAHVMAAA